MCSTCESESIINKDKEGVDIKQLKHISKYTLPTSTPKCLVTKNKL